jgi:hypothetical protein
VRERGGKASGRGEGVHPSSPAPTITKHTTGERNLDSQKVREEALHGDVTLPPTMVPMAQPRNHTHKREERGRHQAAGGKKLKLHTKNCQKDVYKICLFSCRFFTMPN